MFSENACSHWWIYLIESNWTHWQRIKTSSIPFGLRIYPDDNYYILHDNCSIHTCAEVQDYLDLVLPNRVLPHPPYSPELNPCEQIGNYIKREYFQIQNVPNAEADDQARLVTKEDIWATLLRIGYSIHENKTLLNNLATSMHRRYVMNQVPSLTFAW